MDDLVMKIPPWEFNRPPNRHQKYSLSDNSREYLNTGRKSDHNKRNPDKSINETADHLPERLQDLLIDIALLSADGRLTKRHWRKTLRTIHGADHYLGEAVDIPVPTPYEEPISLGYQLGLALRMFQQSAGVNGDMEDIIWGIIIASTKQSGRRFGEKEKESVADLLSEIRRRVAQHRQEDESFLDVFSDDYAAETVHNLLDKELGTAARGAAVTFNKAIRYNARQKPEKFRKALRLLNRSTPIVQTIELEKSIQHDLGEWSKNSEIRGINALELFRLVYIHHNKLLPEDDLQRKLTSSDIHRLKEQETMAHQSVDQGSVTKALEFLSNPNADLDNEYRWPKHPFICKQNGEWEPTAYGAIVTKCRGNSSNLGTRWLYDVWMDIRGIEFELPSHLFNWKNHIIPALEEVFDSSFDAGWIRRLNREGESFLEID